MTAAEARRAILESFTAAVDAVEPRSVVADYLDAHGEDLEGGTVGIVAIGKAAAPMVWGARDALGERLVSGVAVGPDSADPPAGITWHTGSHPLPDERSEAAGRAIIEYLQSAEVGSVLFLISGGGSALAEVPPNGVNIDALADIQRRLLNSGIPVDELNLARRSLSLIKNGRLLDHTRVPHFTLLVSDVGDAGPEVIASGPTISTQTSAAAVTSILDRAGLEIGTELAAHLTALVPTRSNDRWAVVADGWSAVEAASKALGGVPVSIPRRHFSGEARRAAPALVRGAGSGFTVAPGEATVTVTGDGVGGRNTEGALTVAIHIDGQDDVVFAALTTDGIDGPTDAAGAVVDGGSAGRIRAAGISPEAALMDNDSYQALVASDDIVRTGPTGTNVADLWFVWRA